ncbi:MAG: hypothetical protein MZW92_37300 [Comamonadaceae bacterium]|nr:hypothetical protein [Comamonadaceae bacterium]
MLAGRCELGSSSSSGAGAILLTFLAGAELDPAVFRRQWKQASDDWTGELRRAVPRLRSRCARWVLGWSPQASWLAGIAMSTTSVAVVYAVMLEFGFNATRLRQDRARGLLHHRPRHGGGAGADLRAVHGEDAGIHRRLAQRCSSSCRGSRRASSAASAAGPRSWRRSF